jgi:hypothetical protein
MHLAVRVAHKYGQDDVERVACGGFSSKRLVKIVHSEGVQIGYSRRRAGTDRLASDVASGSSLQDVDGIATNTTGPAWKVGALAKVAGLTVRALQPHDSAPRYRRTGLAEDGGAQRYRDSRIDVRDHGSSHRADIADQLEVQHER